MSLETESCSAADVTKKVCSKDRQTAGEESEDGEWGNIIVSK